MSCHLPYQVLQPRVVPEELGLREDGVDAEDAAGAEGRYRPEDEYSEQLARDDAVA